ncbi:hypothetical protein PybrP1_009708 [[Pythium] brassicae (nom. inval.)]|nr:hypothetical protein PybrP1_009708 [[Pythium] brassicae (nom. inval.)]
MRVAIAGAGTLAKLLTEELHAAGHEVVILSRSHKDFFDGKPGVACKQSPKCKRYIPAEFGGNAEDHPESADSVFHNCKLVRDALKAQTEVEWTVVSLGWIMEYIVPSENRYHHNPGPMHPLDLQAKTITIPGTGNDVFSVTSARDTAKAVAELLKSSRKWREFTYVQGEETTLLKMAETMKTVGGVPDLKIEFVSVDELKKTLELKESFMSMLVAEFKLMVPVGFCTLNQSRVQRDRDEFFPTLRFRTMADLLTAAKENPQAIV